MASAVYARDLDISILGIPAKILLSAKEICLFISASLALTLSIMSIVSDYFKMIIIVYVKSKYPPEIAKFQSILYMYDQDSIPTLEAEILSVKGGTTVTNIYQMSITTAALFMLLFIIFLAVLQYTLTVYIIFDVYQNPSLPMWIVLSIISYSAVSLLFTTLAPLSLHMPFPRYDLSFYERLEKVRQKDPVEFTSLYKSRVRRTTHMFKMIYPLIFISIAIFIFIQLIVFPENVDVKITLISILSLIFITYTVFLCSNKISEWKIRVIISSNKVATPEKTHKAIKFDQKVRFIAYFLSTILSIVSLYIINTDPAFSKWISHNIPY